MSRKIAQVSVTLESVRSDGAWLRLECVEPQDAEDKYPRSHTLRIPYGDSVATNVGSKHRLVLMEGSDD